MQKHLFMTPTQASENLSIKNIVTTQVPLKNYNFVTILLLWAKIPPKHT
jgi:hypothetical protein